MDTLAKASTPSVDELAATLKTFGLDSVPKAPNTFPALNPVDVYRSHITELLASVTDLDPKVIYPAIQWTQTLDKGDVAIPVPALRVKGKKPVEFAAELAALVCIRFRIYGHLIHTFKTRNANANLVV
jgi:arginyl-tRNA synthetase